MATVRVKILNEEFFEEYPLPDYATSESAGLDLRACIPAAVTVYAGQRFLCPTGLSVDLDNHELGMFLLPKSGLGHKKGIVLGNCVGLVDSDYHQEIFMSVWNSDEREFVIQPGDFLAQAVFLPVVRVQWKVVTDFNREVERNGGFGSTGSR